MAVLRLKYLLLASRVVVGLLLCGAFVLSFTMIGLIFDAATGSSEVRLALNTSAPNLFTAAYNAEAGFEDGSSGRHQRAERGPLPALQNPSTGFELAADPQMPLLRYREPNAYKRVALLFLGASDSVYSLSWLVLLCAGSWLLWRLLLDVTPATPFTFANARRLARLALLVLGLNLGQHVAYLLVRVLVPAFQAPGLAQSLNHFVQLNTENTLPGAWTGVMLVVIAAVYRRGVELSQEAELVI